MQATLQVTKVTHSCQSTERGTKFCHGLTGSETNIRHEALITCSPQASLLPHLNMFISKQIFHKCSVNSGHACMMNSKPVGQKILQLQVLCDKEQRMRQVFLWSSPED